MSDAILITYATRTGLTAGVAEFIGETLREQGWAVEVRPLQAVTDLAPYAAIVVGSAIQNKQWLPEAMQFVQQHQHALGQKPTAMFTVCMTLAMRKGEKYRPEVANWTAAPRALVHPLNENHFAGVLDISKVEPWQARIGFRLSVWFRIWSEGDHRDWDAIRSWAEQLSEKLLPVAF